MIGERNVLRRCLNIASDGADDTNMMEDSPKSWRQILEKPVCRRWRG